MSRTLQQLENLAKFAGGVLRKHKHYPAWIFDGDDCTKRRCIDCSKWHPDTNPAHMMLVLEALVKASAKKLRVSMRLAGGGILLDLSDSIFDSTGNDFNLLDAICSAAEEAMEKKCTK